MARETSPMIEIRVINNMYIIQGPTLRLALTKGAFVAALKRAKAMPRQAALAARLAKAQEAACRPSSHRR